jgi:hypothetical protein
VRRAKVGIGPWKAQGQAKSHHFRLHQERCERWDEPLESSTDGLHFDNLFNDDRLAERAYLVRLSEELQQPNYPHYHDRFLLLLRAFDPPQTRTIDHAQKRLF